jgi:hypothetical protein
VVFFFWPNKNDHPKEGFQVKTKDRETLDRRQEEKDRRLDPSWQPDTDEPVFGGSPLRYEMAERVKAVTCGGLGLIVQLVKHIGLAEAIDEALHLLKRHRPYHESDHVLSMVYNIVTGGHCLEDLEQLRQDVGYMDAVGAWRIPDPTTAGDFLRRFTKFDVTDLMDAINGVRKKVWQSLSPAMLHLALIDVDGTISGTQGNQKEGADFAYNGIFGYAPLVLTLANTQEVLYVVNRPGNRPSHDDSFYWLKESVNLVKSGGFEKARLRGDTDFSLTAHFDYWSEEGVEFVFGMDSHPSFVNRSKDLQEPAWHRLKRSSVKRALGPKFQGRNFRAEKIEEREFLDYHLAAEYVAEIPYQPRKSKKTYRMVILRKHINVRKGQQRLEDEIRYHFYVTNVPKSKLKAKKVIFQSNARCHQENVIKQLKSGVRALKMPTGGFVANWAYMVIGALAWNLKMWLGLTLPEHVTGADGRELLRMEYRRFVEEIIRVPAQIVKTGRYLVYRLLSFSRWSELLLEGSEWFRRQRRRYASSQ